MTQVHDDPRLAWNLERYHTRQMMKGQSGAEHSAHVVRILLAIWPSAPRHVIVEALFRNIGRSASGDIPVDVRTDVDNRVADSLNRMADDARLRMLLTWGIPKQMPLMENEKHALQLANNLEVWETMMFEQMLGNRFVDAKLAEAAVHDLLHKLHCDAPIRIEAERYLLLRVKAWRLP